MGHWGVVAHLGVCVSIQYGHGSGGRFTEAMNRPNRIPYPFASVCLVSIEFFIVCEAMLDRYGGHLKLGGTIRSVAYRFDHLLLLIRHSGIRVHGTRHHAWVPWERRHGCRSCVWKQ
jgi:hypothetical protein